MELLGYFPQPRCEKCGRFAKRSGHFWTFTCSWWDGDTWVHP